MFYRTIALLFILSSTVLQVQPAHACDMDMDHGAIKMDCCCLHPGIYNPATTDSMCRNFHVPAQKNCCYQHTTSSQQFITENSNKSNLTRDRVSTGPPLPAVIREIDHKDVLNVEGRLYAFEHVRSIYFGIPVYLATDRLRI